MTDLAGITTTADKLAADLMALREKVQKIRQFPQRVRQLQTEMQRAAQRNDIATVTAHFERLQTEMQEFEPALQELGQLLT